MTKTDYFVTWIDAGNNGQWETFSGRGALGQARNWADVAHGKLYRRATKYDLKVGLDKATETLKLVEVFP